MTTEIKHFGAVLSKLHELSERIQSVSSISQKKSRKKNSESTLQSELLRKQEAELEFVLSSLLPKKQQDISLSGEIESMTKALSSLAEVAEQGIITQDESVALAHFLSERFADRYLTKVVNLTLLEIRVERPKVHGMRFMRGAFKE